MDAISILLLCDFFLCLLLLCFWLCKICKKNNGEDFENRVIIIIDPEDGCYKSLHKTKYGKALETELFRWHHKKKYQKDIKEELMPVAWHPSRYWDWCMADEEKKTAEQLWN